LLASSNRATGPSTPMKKVNRFPARDRWCGTPASVSAEDTSLETDPANESTAAYTSGVQARSVARPAAVASGLPDRVPAWYTSPEGAMRCMYSALPP
jgi:hypothetical protein